MPVVTRWGSVNRMMHSLEANEASLKLAVSYPEFPGNPSSRVNAAEKTRGHDSKELIEDARFWAVVGGISSFTKPPSDVGSHVQQILARGVASHILARSNKNLMPLSLDKLTGKRAYPSYTSHVQGL